MKKRASGGKSGGETAGERAAPVAGPVAVSTRATGLLSSLGLHGLSHLDAPVLAALASETPLLLIGPHGSAKSALLERLAVALRLEHRHYNASLISFDDLVGFPVPDGDGLRYLRTPATLWGAQSVFLDEISRCRPEVQNKLFSIVHEKRVQGIALDGLRYRWAAMNPPAAPDASDELDVYVGSLPLDPALADRFGFVLHLPALDDLSPEARRCVIRSGLGPARPEATAVDVPALVVRCGHATALCAALHGDWITAYTSALIVPLRQAGLAISGRRAAMLAANIAAVHGARTTLGGYTVDNADNAGTATKAANAGRKKAPLAERSTIADAALVALRYSLPHRAQGKPVDAGVVASIHRQAIDAASQSQGDATLARILDEVHPVRRVGLALDVLKTSPGRVERHTMSLLVTDALASQDKQARWILAQALLPSLVELDCVDATTLELLAEPFTSQVSFEERPNLWHEVPRSRIAGFNALVTAMEALDTGDPDQVALGNLGAALYAHDDGASEPELLTRLQSALRAQLDLADDHAA
ncbi:MAG: MoxR family ATPase [Proteobacteria bacterium]|nr:MoxR family ATPase [Pseudomonadota bacterium]